MDRSIQEIIQRLGVIQDDLVDIREENKRELQGIRFELQDIREENKAIKIELQDVRKDNKGIRLELQHIRKENEGIRIGLQDIRAENEIHREVKREFQKVYAVIAAMEEGTYRRFDEVNHALETFKSPFCKFSNFQSQ